MKTEHYLERIGKVIDFLRQNPEQNMTIKELARIAMFSEFHFHRIFKKVTGETLRKYIKRLRMEKACFFLEADCDIEIQELWSQLGYNTASHFSKDFKMFFGCTPSQYQNRIKEKKNKNRLLLDKTEKTTASYIKIQQQADAPASTHREGVNLK